MSRKNKRKPGDESTLDRDALERELVRKDKQALITDCLKLFDLNRSLTLLIEARVKRIGDVEDENRALRVENARLEGRTWVKVLNLGIEQRINRLRNKRELRNRA